MLDTNPQTKSTPSLIAQAVKAAIGETGLRLKVNMRLGHLAIICEGKNLPTPQVIIRQIQKSLQNSPHLWQTENITHINIHGLVPGQDYPLWSETIVPKLSSTSSNLGETAIPHSVTPPSPLAYLIPSPSPTLGAIVATTAIAQTLLPLATPFGVQIKVDEVQTKGNIPVSPIAFLNLGKSPAPQETTDSLHLRVHCHCEYPLAPERIVPLLIQKLRQLNLTNYRDVLLSGYLEEKQKPLWVVKSHLASAQQLLQLWAAWGDKVALVELLNVILEPQGIGFRSIHKDATLHLFSSTLEALPPEQSVVLGAIAPLLQKLVPPSIEAVVVYGITNQGRLDPTTETPAWVEWINLPPPATGAIPELPAKELARKGDEGAIAFLLQKAVNPDLKYYLATGGMEVLVKQQDDLLHVVIEAPLCPSQTEVVRAIVRCLSSLKIPTIAGVRIYGRPIGKSHPDWRFGKDFSPRSSFLSKLPTPQTPLPRSTPVAPEFTPPQPSKPFQKNLGRACSAILTRTGIFFDNPTPESISLNPKVALVWGALGLLLLIQADWLLGLISKRNLTQPAAKGLPAQTSHPSNLPTSPQVLGSIPDTQGFNSSGFTASGNSVVVVDQQNQQVKSARIAQATSTLSGSGEHNNPSFNSSLLNDKLLLYQQRVNQTGHPADVMIVGSSRALRGIDPLVLKEALAQQGYKQVDIFNFGINGASVKFVDFLLRRMLTPEQLPKLIIWADGVRAFNGGREDLTYNALVGTEGYRQVIAGAFPVSTQSSTGNTSSNQSSIPSSLARFNYTTENDRLLQTLSSFSQSYSSRQQLLETTQRNLGRLLPGSVPNAQPQNLGPKVNESAIDIDGFLPLSDRFDPQTYYQKYAMVPGNYDKDYEGFHLDGRQDAALGELSRYLRGRGVAMVFVNLPLTDYYLDPVRTSYEQQFEQYLRERSQQHKFIVRNLNTTHLKQYQYFSDPSHLNRYGAEVLARQLAQDPVIPWTSR